MKKLCSLFLALLTVLSLLPAAAFAAADEAAEAAEGLYSLGLFQGTGTNADGTPIYSLDRVPTRNQAIIMLIRLLGREEEALAGSYETPFTDITSANMAQYIGYAYENGLSNGVSATAYGGERTVKANQYITFVLRALGYVSGEDFTVSEACRFADSIGLTNGEYTAGGKFTRAMWRSSPSMRFTWRRKAAGTSSIRSRAGSNIKTCLPPSTPGAGRRWRGRRASTASPTIL